ncbi:hypothetical protein VE01_03774 [Pseudogymnoascus verrucosus]|uniref:Uncharacterized protein n=1 Tax=Pseudogymnoascus verrucosus TaxID=342668 RepID=A0A1B8GQQ0_9PEZI|nr:uncharacterized protein VE01_03774 [Pseudogymnoascus verrucosus]OBT98144.1 hypothetical protein VE01_03774 [Pseudogymnoascus verrucosus]
MSYGRNSAPDLIRNPGFLYVAGVKQKKRRSATITYQCDFGGDCQTAVAKSTYFCNTHKCDADECYSLKKFNVQTGRHFLYCPKHKCVRETCERSHPTTQPHCITHTCSKEVCIGMVEGDEKLCARHIRCSYRNCPSNRMQKDGEYQKFCSRHSSCTSSPCTREKKLGSEFCDLHTCPMRYCTKRCSGNHFYCSDHICDHDGCGFPRTFYLERDNVVPTNYCPIHECQEPSCHLNAPSQTCGYCRAHNCDEPNCNGLKLINPGGKAPLTKCLTHYNEFRDRSRRPRSPPTAPPPAPPAPPAPPPTPPSPAITLTTLSSQVSRLQRTANSIQEIALNSRSARAGAAGDARAASAEEAAVAAAAEAERRLEEVSREQRLVADGISQQDAKINAILNILRERRRYG